MSGFEPTSVHDAAPTFQFKFWMSFWLIFYSLSVFALTTAWYNLKTFLIDHHIYVLGYFFVVGLVSFAFTYRMVCCINSFGFEKLGSMLLFSYFFLKN
jgi:hypothetical protein